MIDVKEALKELGAIRRSNAVTILEGRRKVHTLGEWTQGDRLIAGLLLLTFIGLPAFGVVAVILWA